MCTIDLLVVEGAESVALRASAAALRVWRARGGVPDGTDEIFTILPPVRRVNAEMRTSLVGHHINATFELRGGGVKAAARRVERSESLDDARAQLNPELVMADFWRQ